MGLQELRAGTSRGFCHKGLKKKTLQGAAKQLVVPLLPSGQICVCVPVRDSAPRSTKRPVEPFPLQGAQHPLMKEYRVIRVWGLGLRAQYPMIKEYSLILIHIRDINTI